jgi:hypothetical protein
MGPGTTFAIVTFCAGVLLLLGWGFATAGNPRAGAMLRKSLLLFVLPIMFIPTGWLSFPLGMWVLVSIEEGLKAFASTRENKRLDKFWLVSLFGIWELTVDKPFWAPAVEQTGSWDRLAMAGFLYATALPVLMHTVTAAIYAFTFRGRLWAAFAASWVVHTAFNETVTYFELSPTAAIIETVILGGLLARIISSQRRPAVVDGS